MPIVNGKYESPIWENNHQPAMDAAEMQAITDSVEESIHALGDYTTPAQKMGLTGDLSVGASLGVLADIGNVHVWRKTVVTEEEVPAGYTLGAEVNSSVKLDGKSSAILWEYSDEVMVSEYGIAFLSSPTTINISGNYANILINVDVLRGKFIMTTQDGSELEANKVYFIPEDASFYRPSFQPYYVTVSKYQPVIAYPLTPAGTHITYLTSTNRNAYQEGDDAKEAGYVLGDMVSGYLFASAWTGNASNYYYSETIKVSDTGTLTQENVKSYTANATNDSWVSNIQSAIRGKFITVSGEKDNGGSEGTDLVYIPDDAIVSYFENGVSLGYPYNYGFLVNKMQQVTGYPAIPAGTTIEYLGVLGNKTIIETGSYVGTGTYGSGNPNTLTFRFEPKFVHIQAGNIGKEDSSGFKFAFFVLGTKGFSIGPGSANELYNLNAKFDGNTLSWYLGNAAQQLNTKNANYFFIALG